MQRLLAFIEHNLYLMLFIVLQVICAFLLFGLNPYQQAAFTHSASELTARSNELSTNVTSYVGLQEQNAELQNQVKSQFLSSCVASFYYLNDTFVVRDSSRRPMYNLIPAQIVYNTSNKAENVFVINKGLKDGIHKHMGVVSPVGVAGIVLRSNENYSTVMSLLNTNFTIFPSINGLDYFSKLLWDNSSPGHMKINGINKLEKIKEGDEVTTVSNTLLFPKGIPIGKISKVKSLPNNQYYQTEVEVATNFRNLRYVYVIENKDYKQISSILSNGQ